MLRIAQSHEPKRDVEAGRAEHDRIICGHRGSLTEAEPTRAQAFLNRVRPLPGPPRTDGAQAAPDAQHCPHRPPVARRPLALPAALATRGVAPGVRTGQRPGPGLWTMAGTWDLPHYTNVQMPFEGRPPEIPDLKPTGVYERRNSSCPLAGMVGGSSLPRLGRGKRADRRKLNGREIGVGKDSHLASEFDLTAHLQPGSNTLLRLTVIKWSDATYIETRTSGGMAGSAARSSFTPPARSTSPMFG